MVVYGLNLYILGLFVCLSFLWGSFVFYKKSIENHLEENQVLDIVVLSAFWGLIVGRLGYVLSHYSIFVKHWSRSLMISAYPGMDRWFVLFGFILALLYLVKKKREKYFDYLDVFSLGYFSGVSWLWVLFTLVGFDWRYLLLGFLNFLSFIGLWQMEKKYRFFEWYKGVKTSARTGFVFGASVALVGLLFWLEEFLMFGFKLDWPFVWSVFCLILGLVIVYIRSGRLLKDDIAIIKKWKKIKTK